MVGKGLGDQQWHFSQRADAFESRYGIALPLDLREYFLAVNGMAEGVMDDSCLSLWSLAEVKPIPEEVPGYNDPSYIEDPQSHFVFADFLLWSHAYAIRLSADAAAASPVSIIDCEPAIKVFDSFAEFALSYLSDVESHLRNLNEP